MSAARPQFSIDDAFELSLEDAGPGPESSGVARFGPLHFERRARFEGADEDKQSRLRYQNLENDEDGAQTSPEPDGGVSTRDSSRTSMRSSQWSFSTISSNTQRSYNACCSTDPGRRGTGSGPLSRCLQRRLLRAGLPVAGPGSLPRDLHLLRRQGPPGLPLLLPALLREVSCRRDGRALIAGPSKPPAPPGVCSGSLGHPGLGLGKSPLSASVP
ncbi:transmembrane protein 134 isoform X1 [Cynocephalus volans]|uniref:transmembrane protein 134 isoform X1 n=1 Tax=Cynocephalus volans TaxID=110931 RepID=UPI002FC86E85